VDLLLHHYWRSSSSWRVRWSLAFKGLAYRSNAIDLLTGAQSSDAFKKDSPMGQVPCLVVDGKPLSESVAILEWLEETHPTPRLLPLDPWMRARTRQLVEIVNAGTQPLQNLVVLKEVSHRLNDKTAAKTWAQKWIVRGLTAFERELEALAAEGVQGPHALGDAVTLADLFLAPQLYNARRQELDLAPFPRALAVEAAALATDAAKASHPDRFQPA
jgi:maleylacetoacetate isomerase